jgi:hypothetical protein
MAARVEYRSNAFDLGTRATRIQSSANNQFMKCLYPTKSRIFWGYAALKNLRRTSFDNSALVRCMHKLSFENAFPYRAIEGIGIQFTIDWREA